MEDYEGIENDQSNSHLTPDIDDPFTLPFTTADLSLNSSLISDISTTDNSPSAKDILLENSSKFPCAFTALHINAQSLMSHIEEFRNIVTNLSYSALFISESWLKPSLNSNLVSIPGYYLLRNDRLGKRGGGVAIFLRNDITSKLLASSCPNYSARPEFLIVELKLKNENVLACVVYRPPKTGYLSELEQQLQLLLPNYSHTLIMGDFNTNLSPQNSSFEAQQLRNIFQSLGLTYLPLNPTFHTASSASLLDLIVVPDSDQVLNFGQVPVPGISHHDLVYVSLQIHSPKPKSQTIRHRNFRSFNEDDFLSDASSMPWNDIVNCPSIDQKINSFNSLITSLYDRHAPYKYVRSKNKPSPWMNDEIRALMSQRDTAYRKFRKNKSLEGMRLKYKHLRNKTKQAIRNSKIRHAFSIISDGNSSKVWNFVKQTGIGKENNHETPLPVTLDELNDYFVGCGAFGSDVVSPCYSLSLTPSGSGIVPQFFFRPVDEIEVYKTIRSAKSTSKGIDDIPLSLLLNPSFLKFIMPILLHIFNFSLSSGQFPACWKSALVRPLPKTRSPQSTSDFRPISLLPALSKVLERLAHKQIVDHITTHNLTDLYQSGFKKGHSTGTALLKVLDDVRLAMDTKMLTIAIALDFSKAFNSVNFSTLLSILQSLNFSPKSIAWFRSYLSGRSQQVFVDNKYSTSLDLENGVPQGSVLGPLLFSIYLNGLPKVLRHSRYHLFADDFLIYCHTPVNKIGVTVAHINIDLESIAAWAKSHSLKINPSKTQAIIFGYSRLLSQINFSMLPQLQVENVPIVYVKKIKYLGITLNERLQWNDHVNLVCGKVFGVLHSLRRCKFLLPINLRKQLVQSLIFPLFDYCDYTMTDITDELSLKLDRALNACVRFIFDLRKDEHISQYYTALAWLRVSDRRYLHVLRLIRLLIHDKTPHYLSEKFTFLNNPHTRSELTLRIPNHRTSVFNKSFTVSGCRAWNALPICVRKSESAKSYREAIKNSLLNNSST
jgi:hypothetical protein